MHYEKIGKSLECIEDELPFEIPDGWAWCRFGAYTINRDSERRPVSSSARALLPKVYDYYGASGAIDKVDAYIFSERLLLIGEDGANLVTRSKPIAFFADGLYWVNNHAHCIDAIEKSMLDYVCYFINAINLEPYVTGSAQPKMTQDKMNSILIPVPPYAEQLRICEKLHMVSDRLASIKSNRTEIVTLISAAKSKILDLAIRGQLVPQDPDDEPASVLLDRIRTEKEQLIKAGKLKRDKKESVIFRGEDNSYYEKVGTETICIDEEIRFDLPAGWSWSRLSSCCVKEIKRGKSPKYANSGKCLAFAQKCNTKSNGIDIGLALSLDDSSLGRYPESEFMQDADIVINSTGTGTLGRVGIYHLTDNHACLPIVPDSHVTVIRVSGNLVAEYIYCFLKSLQSELEESGEGSTNQKELKPATLMELLVPVPPYREQEMIRKQVAGLFNKMEMLEDSLN